MKQIIGNRLLALAFMLGNCHIFLSPAWGAGVDPNYYKYSVRHEKGAPPFFPMAKIGNELVNSANGNIHFTIPLLSRIGRKGLGVNLGLSYNSKVWDHYVSNGSNCGTTPTGGLCATIAERDSWVGLGWTLLVGRVIYFQTTGQYFVTLSDGSNHELFDYGSGVWRSRDSSYMIYKPLENKLILKGGLTLIFGYGDYYDSNIRYATKVQDTNGNYIDITYRTGPVVGTGGRIDKIEDTLGNTYTFYLDAVEHQLWRIGVDWNYITFQYAPRNLAHPVEATDPSLLAQFVLTSLHRVSNEHLFTYYGSGLIEKITYPTCGKSRYIPQLVSVWDRPLGRSVWELMVLYRDTGEDPPSSSPIWGFNLGTFPATQVGPSSVTITTPSSKWIHDMWMGSGGWSDGFLKTGREQTLGNQTISETRQYWTQDNETDPNVVNPRVLRLEKGLKPQGVGVDKVLTTDYGYALASDFSGNVKGILEYAYGQYGAPGLVRRETQRVYLHEINSAYAALNILDRVVSTVVKDGSNNLIAKTEAVYDQLAVVPTSFPAPPIRHDTAYGPSYATRGLPNAVFKYYDLANNLSVSTVTQYDEFGNPRIVTDAKNYSTTMDYAWPSYAFAVQMTNPRGHVTQATYSDVGGVILTQTDANNKVTTSTYDYLWRISQVTKPGGGTTNYTYNVGCNSYATIVEAITATTSRTRRAELDNMGRVKETRTDDPVGGNGNISQTTQYNSLDQVSSSSLPFRATQPVYLNSYSYNASLHASTTLAEGGTIGYSYDLNTTTVTNTDGKQRKNTYQEDGKIIQVLEEGPAGPLTVPTNYAYDPLARLVTITQGGQTRTFTYDALGRLKTEKHPESSAAGNSFSYTYDANSNIVSKTDARGMTTSFLYDELNRVTEKKYNDVTVVTYSYDTQPSGSPIAIQNPIGRLTKLTRTTDGVTASNYYSYCNCSAVDKEATVIQDGATEKAYVISYAYNYVGEITSITYPPSINYPNGKTVNYTYDSVGRETKVSFSGIPGTIDYVRLAEYGGPQGGLTKIEHTLQWGTSGTYVQTNVTYSPTTMRMTNLVTLGLNLNFKYNVPAIGKQTGHIYDIDNLFDETGNSNRHYEYDRWYRLTRSWEWPTRTGGQLRNITWTYDDYGNVLSTDRYGSVSNFSVEASTNRLNGTGYVYDPAGNMTGAPGGITRAFDAENRMISTNQGGLTFLYDGSGRRLRKLDASTKIYFVYSATGRLMVEDNWTSAKTKNHIYFNGQLIATHDQADSVRMLFKDNLGSTRSVAKVFLPTGSESWGSIWQVVEVHDWEPYGNLYSGYWDDPADRVTQKFTGQKRDTETNLDYFGARYYDPGVGTSPGNPRWISPDPVMNRPEDPPSLNKYTYARTDPINLIDPDGKDPEAACSGDLVYVGFGQWACVTSTAM